MKKQNMFGRLLAVLLSCLMLFTGCQNSADVQTTAADVPDMTAAPETQAPETEALTEAPETEAPTEAPADRYEEIIDLSAIEGKLAIYFLDLEEITSGDEHSGDSTLLISPDGKVMLIDAGHTPCGDEITAFLKELGITRIDYLVASHAHIDHIGGMPEIVANFEIGTHYRTPVEYTTQTYANYVSAIENAGIPVEYVHEGDSFMFGEHIKVDIYNPPEEIEYPDETVSSWNQFMNDHSMLMKMTYGESTFLTGGDLYVAAEQLLMQAYGDQLQADVAKVNHHGYSTSTSRKWVKTTLPQIAVAMGDVMGSMDTYERYTKEGAVYYHTFVDGYVRVIADDARNYEVTSQYDSWLR
ncbi:MAG: MBL fold metallo-hydrolase [Lachnospiraceae bacterium]|nr:MBL fold metallo-hydrolase [Lachnospiraceae bacterium]